MRQVSDEADRLTRSIIERSPTGIAVVDQTGAYVVVNPAYCDIYGYREAELIGRCFTMVFPPHRRAAMLARHHRFLAVGTALSGELEVVRSDGAPITVAVDSIRVEGFAGAPCRLVYVSDITERKRAEAQRELAHQVFELAGEAIFVCDLDGRLQEVNAEACRLAKYSREQMLRLRNVDIVAPAEVDRIAPELAQCDEGAIVENRWMLRCSDGSTVPLDLVVQRLPGDRYLAIGRDLRERERVVRELAAARDAAEAANRAKSRFLAAASHDLRQPIQAIRLFHAALAHSAVNDEQRRLCAQLAASTQNLADILDSLLDVSRLDSGSVAARQDAVPVAQVFRSIAEEFGPLAQGRGLRFKLAFPCGELALRTDPSLLLSLLRNLIDNALKYTQRGGVLVAVRRRGGMALLQVWDSGSGIGTEHLAKIFEEYYQVGNPQRDRRNGLGLGLAIARRVAALLGAEIVCRTRPGRGSVFEFSLPFASPVAPMMRDRPPTVRGGVNAPRPPGEPPRIVVVDDDDTTARALAQVLEDHGMRAQAFASAEEALADPTSVEADFVIADYRLPGCDGVRMLDQLQALRSEPLNAAILTGDLLDGTRRCPSAHPWRVLRKPVAIEALLEVIEQATCRLRSPAQ